MSHDFKIGDHVRWNSEAGHVTGTIRNVGDRAVRDVVVRLERADAVTSSINAGVGGCGFSLVFSRTGTFNCGAP